MSTETAETETRRTKRNLGEIIIDNAPFSVWVESNQVCFRRKFKRRVTIISLPDIYSHAEGQLSLPLGGAA